MQPTQEAIAELIAAKEQILQSVRSGAEIAKRHYDIIQPDHPYGWLLAQNTTAEDIISALNVAAGIYQSRKLKPEFQP